MKAMKAMKAKEVRAAAASVRGAMAAGVETAAAAAAPAVLADAEATLARLLDRAEAAHWSDDGGRAARTAAAFEAAVVELRDALGVPAPAPVSAPAPAPAPVSAPAPAPAPDPAPAGAPCVIADAGQYYAGVSYTEQVWDRRASGGWSSNPDDGWEVDGWRTATTTSRMDPADPRFPEWNARAAECTQAASEVRAAAIRALVRPPNDAAELAALAADVGVISNQEIDAVYAITKLARGETCATAEPAAVAVAAEAMRRVMLHDPAELVGRLAEAAAAICPAAAGVLNAACYRPAMYGWQYADIARDWAKTLKQGSGWNCAGRRITLDPASDGNRKIRNTIRREVGVTVFVPAILGGDDDE